MASLSKASRLAEDLGCGLSNHREVVLGDVAYLLQDSGSDPGLGPPPPGPGLELV